MKWNLWFNSNMSLHPSSMGTPITQSRGHFQNRKLECRTTPRTISTTKTSNFKTKILIKCNQVTDQVLANLKLECSNKMIAKVVLKIITNIILLEWKRTTKWIKEIQLGLSFTTTNKTLSWTKDRWWCKTTSVKSTSQTISTASQDLEKGHQMS